jgi:hypothetical protein
MVPFIELGTTSVMYLLPNYIIIMLNIKQNEVLKIVGKGV